MTSPFCLYPVTPVPQLPATTCRSHGVSIDR